MALRKLNSTCSLDLVKVLVAQALIPDSSQVFQWDLLASSHIMELG
jgi:hypothetical protein